MIIRTLLQVAYVVLLVPIGLYALSVCFTLLLYFRRHTQTLPPPPKHVIWPLVAVQVPLYNERYVASRIMEAVAALDYPRDRLHIQILDDSTDDTPQMLAPRIAELRDSGLRIELVRRENRTGYKAGALANGFEHTEADFLAVFDADFVPPPNFLRQTVPYLLADPGLGMVQARWTHLNAEMNLLTRVQALLLDGHFVVEQTARSANGLFVGFNGTGGIWRRQCIQDAGGWQADTLAEDADLSYRAQLAGWRCTFLTALTVPGELPPQMAGLKLQQARWAGGTTGVLLKLGGRLWGAPFPRRTRIMGFFNLLAYPIQTMALALLLLHPFLILAGALEGLNALPLAPLSLLGLAVPVMYVVGQGALYRDWARRCLAIPALLVIGIGLSVGNSRAVLAAVRGQKPEFRRTPKFRVEGDKDRWRSLPYAKIADPNLLYEVAFGLYAVVGAVVAAERAPSLVVYFAIYALGFFATAGWTSLDRWLGRQGGR